MQAVYVTGTGLLSPPLDGSGLGQAQDLGGLLCGRVATALEPGMPRLHALALAAGAAAVAQAPGLVKLKPEAKAIFVSASKGGLEAFNTAVPELGPSLDLYRADAPGQRLRAQLGWNGGGRNTPLACATGAYSVGLAFEALRHGRIQAALAGAAEASLTPLLVAAYRNLGALSPATRPDAYAGPFDRARAGFVLAEGAAALLLENEEGLALSGHRPLARLCAWSCTNDAYHLTAPEPEGTQAARCLSQALAGAAMAPASLGYLNAHGTATPVGDLAEALALRRVFGPGEGPRVSSIKGAIGHALGASAAIEAVVTVRALMTGRIPANLRCQHPLSEIEDWLALKEEPLRGSSAASLSMGFGGHNVALVFEKA
jgi:3-oxoacyl-[acyl-carrier-protein] synthase II